MKRTDRIAEATRMFLEHEAEIRAAAATLPERVTLGDGRVLKFVKEMSGGKAYRCRDGMAAIVSYDATAHGLLLHVSISYADRDPRWRDLKAIRAAFFPADVDVIQVLPRAGEFVNVHVHCFHLFQAPETWQGGWNV